MPATHATVIGDGPGMIPQIAQCAKKASTNPLSVAPRALCAEQIRTPAEGNSIHRAQAVQKTPFLLPVCSLEQ